MRTRETPRYDLFLSLSGDERPAARRLCRELRAAGLEVFLDEDGIRDYFSINTEIQEALVNSTALLAYYSVSYSTRPACQLELTAALLGGLSEGDAARRVLVINPEPGTDHLLPTELADAKFPTLDMSRGPKSLVPAIRARLAELDGPFGSLRFADRPPWFGSHSPGAPPGFVGRYQEQWRLHSALVDCDHPMTREPRAGAQVVLAGLPGSGRTSVVAAYAWQFGAAHPSGVYWLSLAGVEGDAEHVLARYAEEVRHLAERLRLPVSGLDRGRLFDAVGDHLAALPAASLWVVDDVPPGLGADTMRQLFAPAGRQARTVLVTRRAEHSATFNTIDLEPMSVLDAGAVLHNFRPLANADPAEVRAHSRLVTRIGGHPQSLVLAGLLLQSIDYASLLDRLSVDTAAAVLGTDLLRDAIDEIDSVQVLLLQIAERLAPVPIPAEVLCQAVAVLHPRTGPDPVAPERCAEALTGLQTRLLATSPRPGEWQFPRVGVAACAAQRGPGAAGLPTVLAGLGRDLLRGRTLDAAARRHLVAHVEALLSTPDADGPDRETRLELAEYAAVHHETRGEPLLASAHREALLRHHPDSAAHLLAWARNRQLTGEPEAALPPLQHLLRTGTEPAVARRALLLRAEAMETLSRFDDAEADWEVLLAGRVSPEVRLARIRSLRSRGHTEAARELVDELLATQHVDDELAPADHQRARVELARCQMLAGDQRGARVTARSVIAYHTEYGLTGHRTMIEAREVLAEALLNLAFWELRPDEENWNEGEALLRETWRGFVDSHGALNPLTLEIAVQHGYALVCLGRKRAEQARMELTRTDTDIAGRLGDTHHLRLRCRFLLGQACAQLKDWEHARELFGFVATHQLATLGPEHPHTLHSQLEWGIALQLTSRESEAAPLIDEVLRTASRVLGRDNDIYGRAMAARLLRHVPGAAWRWITRKM